MTTHAPAFTGFPGSPKKSPARLPPVKVPGQPASTPQLTTGGVPYTEPASTSAASGAAAPTARRRSTTPADLLASMPELGALLTPGGSLATHTPREIAEAAHALGVQPKPAAQTTLPTPAKVGEDLGAAISHLLSGVVPKTPAPPKQPSAPAIKPTGPTPAIRRAEVKDAAAFAREQGKAPAPRQQKPTGGTLADGTWSFTKVQLHPNGAGGQAVPTKRDPASYRNSKMPGYIFQDKTAWTRGGASPAELKKAEQQSGVSQRPVNSADPLGKKTLGNVTAAQLVQAGRGGTLRINKRGTISTPVNRQALLTLQQARKAVADSRTLSHIKPGSGQHTPEEYAALLQEESRKQGVKLTPAEIAEGVGVVFAESGGEASNSGQGPEGHIGPYSESPTFGSAQERLDPRTATAAAIKQFVADGRSWNPAWVHWQEIQGEEETGADRAAQYLPIAREAAQGGAGVNPKALNNLHTARAAAAALGIQVKPPGQQAGNVTYVHQTAKTALQWAENALGVSTGSKREVGFAELVGGVTDPWCAVFVSTALKKVGIEPPANPSYSGAFAENWKGGKVLGTTDLAKAKPGDLLIFDWGNGGQTDHVAIYKGGNQMIGGNQGAGEVSLEEVPASSIVTIVRPKYQGKVVAVANTPVGSTTGAASTGVGGTGEGVEGAAIAQAAGEGQKIRSEERRQRALGSASYAQVPISELLQTLALTPNPPSEEGSKYPSGAIGRILARKR